MEREIEIEAKRIFDKHYWDQLDKNLYPRFKARELALDEAQQNILDYNCRCQWRMDFLVAVRDYIKNNL